MKDRASSPVDLLPRDALESLGEGRRMTSSHPAVPTQVG